MPLYEYQCVKCNQRIEVIQRHSDPPPAECEKCGAGEMKKLHSAPAIQFKGSGFYKTDYASGSSSASTLPAGKSDSASGSGTDTKSGSDAKGGGDSKPAAETKSSSSDGGSKSEPKAASSKSE